MRGRKSIVYLYTTRTPRAGTGAAAVADLPVYSIATGKRTRWLGSSFGGQPQGDQWAELAPEEIDAWLFDQGLELRRGSINGE